MAQSSDFATGVFTPPPVVVSPSRAQRLTLRLLQAAAVAVVLAAATYRTFELDRFFVPKELVLHLAALLAGLLALGFSRRVAWGPVDWALSGFLVLGVASALLAANPWAAQRALAVSVSGAVVFWAARGLGRAGLGPALTSGLALAVVVGAATSLAQTYGLRLDVFSLNRAPGGTLGNRNFVAHLCAFGMPVLMLTALRARTFARFLPAAVGFLAAAATLVLTRSRAGWLGAAAAIGVFALGWLLSAPVRRDRPVAGRLALLLVFVATGVAAGIVIPNKLRWASDNPYADTAADLVNFQEGSGKGRMIQFRNSLRMTAAHPLLGVGPGNWSVAYPRFAERRDPSMDGRAPGMTANPWPSSDWAAFFSERGVLAGLLLLAVFAGLGLAALAGALRAADREQGLVAIAMGATVAAALVVGLFDAVLLLALPALLIWGVLGALSGELPASPRARTLPGVARPLAALLLLALVGTAVARSAAQVAAMSLYEQGGRASLQRAARLDPGSYRIRVRLARAYSARRDCALRREQVQAARALYPEAEVPVRVGRCRR